ncbi:hypothetical protein DAPPUDRAFT_311182 [Daphnia pulex]|uniref:Receptor-type tyrosine-protein phosphatase N2 n=1 Tax=Daphnia pulex TaxID=6669 RepID=E9FUX3_DAPPU|nr:hypothetical protein DAPPUDRAFT_311182 [Daphnia pulex]|eukprot:EFX88841.1 hypothetical protein DAPPUDRAFT_311182 [Daphnia pulex]
MCEVGKEWCYDDAIFGQCLLLKTEALDSSSVLHRNLIGEVELAALEAALTELKRMGYQWTDPVTQCVLQRLFLYLKNKGSGTPDVCLELDEINKKGSKTHEEKQNNNLAHGTSRSDQDFLQAPIYLSRNDILGLEDLMKDDLYDTNDNQNLFSENGPSKEFNNPKKFSDDARSSDTSFSHPLEYPHRNYKDAEQQLTNLKQILSSVKKTNIYNESPQAGDDVLFDSEEDDFNLPPGSIYANSQFERQERLDVKKPGPWFSVNNFAFEHEENDDDNLSGTWALSNESPVFEERYIPIHSIEDLTSNRDFRKNNYLVGPKTEDGRKNSMQSLVEKSVDESDTDDIFSKKTIESPTHNMNTDNKASAEEIEHNLPKTEKQHNAKIISPVHLDRENEDTNYVFITIKGEFLNWRQGTEFVKALCDVLKIHHNNLYDVSVLKNKVSFRIQTQDKDLNPSLIASKADEMRLKIKEVTGFELDTTGSGEQSSVSSVHFWGQGNQQMLLTAGLCVLTSAILVSAGIFLLLRSRHLARQKLKEFTQSADSEATRDYQDLCRARMAIKGSTPEPTKDPSKMPHALLSRDSESSRSSTSSWCEEPVLTNMDISTGHIVLSYMEDHLRNKFRLEQEWQALCSYEAETSTSFLVASKPENNEKNRYGDVLPYDHSRVVLNVLANTSGADYINASSITDHDPRHPAYIAAQSPVAQSVSDFWQMIWEQGSVVLVLLTKIVENGEELCHKYWPEEGSQLYHIYEVHLVSEHIWCDDYLVRSFYLKNIRTGETRTVTQFHFQSWPENGVPSSTKALLEFRRKVNKSYRGRSCPIVVHCSDGAGRTGTYCLIDMVLHRMAKGAREIDIAATLEHLRDQRPHAVRTKQQFEFVLTAVAEEVHAILRALPQ